MNESTMEDGTSKRKKMKKRTKAPYKELRKHGDLKDYAHGKKDMGVDSGVDGKENNADRELRRMVQGHTSKSGKNAMHSKRRYS